LLWNYVKRVETHVSSSSPRHSTCSSKIDSKEDKSNRADEGLEEEPPPKIRVKVGAPWFSILAQV
jgi:hypothetical protein